MQASRPPLLFLAHRIPYPPDKGDKIRSYRWLRALCERYAVHLGAFIDDPGDWVHVDTVGQWCASTLFVPLARRRAMLRSLTGLLTGEPLSLPFYRDARMRRWVRERVARYEIGHTFVYSSAMAQYLMDEPFARARRVIDFVDVDSDKWRQYAESKRWPMDWVYRRESRRLAHTEMAIASRFDASLFVSAPEAAHFRRRWPKLERPITAISNGVDIGYFAPEHAGDSPFPPGRTAVVFTGAMDYWANVEAVIWFAAEVWPRVCAKRPDALFVIVGSSPSPEVSALAGERIMVTGRVPDVRPYLGHADCVVAPLRIARGIQNKVLEGMAMARAVVTTYKGLEGIDAEPGRDLLVADDAGAFAEAVLSVLEQRCGDCGANGRRRLVEHYDWASACEALAGLVAGSEPEHSGRRRIVDGELACAD